MYSKIISDFFELKHLGYQLSDIQLSRLYSNARKSYILKSIYESIKNLPLNMDSVAELNENKPVIYNGDTILGINNYNEAEFKQGDNRYGKNLYGCYLMQLLLQKVLSEKSDVSVSDTLILSAFVFFPHNQLNDFIISRTKFLYKIIKEFKDINPSIDINEFVNTISKSCGKISVIIDYPMPDSFKGIGDDEKIYTFVWNYIILLVNGIDIDKTSIKTINKSLTDFFTSKSETLKKFEIKESYISYAFKNIEYLLEKFWRFKKDSGDSEFDTKRNNLIKAIFRVEENGDDLIKYVKDSANESNIIKNRLLFLS